MAITLGTNAKQREVSAQKRGHAQSLQGGLCFLRRLWKQAYAEYGIFRASYRKGSEIPFGARPPASAGFALLIAVIFMSVMLTFGLALGSLAYKQQIIASSALESQYAFYAADAALECTLYQDQRFNLFGFDNTGNPPVPSYLCDGAAPLSAERTYPTIDAHAYQKVTYQFALDSDTRCASVTVYKPADVSQTSYLFSQGYNVSCTTVNDADTGARYASRGLEVHY